MLLHKNKSDRIEQDREENKHMHEYRKPWRYTMLKILSYKQYTTMPWFALLYDAYALHIQLHLANMLGKSVWLLTANNARVQIMNWLARTCNEIKKKEENNQKKS